MNREGGVRVPVAAIERGMASWLLGVILAACAPSAGAQDAQDAQEIIEHRIAGFRDMGSAFKNIGDQLKAREPNVAKIQTSASAINDYRAALPGWFPPGSEPAPREPESWFSWICRWFSCAEGYTSATEESRAKKEIWAEPERFQEAYQRFDAAAQSMMQATRGGSLDVMTVQFKRLEATCKGCHEVFREEEE